LTREEGKNMYIVHDYLVHISDHVMSLCRSHGTISIEQSNSPSTFTFKP